MKYNNYFKASVLIVFSIITVFSIIIFSDNVNAEVCRARNLLGSGDIFWGNPPPIDRNQPPPRAYLDVNAGPGDIVRLSAEGEVPGAGGGCAGLIAQFEIYPDGSVVPIRNISGSLVSGSGITGGNFGSWQYYIDWPHDLPDGSYRFRVVGIQGFNISPSILSTNLLIITGAGPPPPPPPASCTASFSPVGIVIGQSTNLTWSSSNDNDGTLQYSCTGNIGSGNTTASGVATLFPNTTQTCTFTAINIAGQSATCTAGVTVTIPLPTISLSANPTSVAYNTSSTLSWTVSNATSCTASGGTWSGNKSATGGSESTGNLTSTQTYTLSCTGAGGTNSASTTVTVGAAPTPIVNLTANPTSIAYNSSSNLSWTSTNSTSCTASGGTWSGSRPISGGPESTGNLTSTQTYTLSCTGAGGTNSASTTVTVGAAPTPPPPAASITCDSLPSSCSVASGNSFTINWICFNSSTGTVTNSGDNTTWTGLSGPQTVINISSSRTYSVVCSGPGGSVSGSVVVNISAPPLPPPPAPQSTFTFFSIPNPFSGSIDTLNDLFDVAISFLYYIVGPIIIIMIILAGLFFLFARGEANKVQTGKRILLYAIIGLVIILIGRGFIFLLENIISLGN